jgi:hypothetical protein
MRPVPLPSSLVGIFFGYRWETSRIWSLPTAITSMPLADLRWHLDPDSLVDCSEGAAFRARPSGGAPSADFPRSSLE